MADDLTRLAADIASAPRRAFPKIQGDIEATLHDIKTTAQADSPELSGRYKRSMSYERTGFKGEVGPESRYGHLVEDGGARSAPNPVMRRASKRHEDSLVERVAKSAAAGLW